MERLTTDNVFEMDMTQLALNQVYIENGWAQYRNGPEDDLSVCDLIRSAAETLGVNLPMLNDSDLSDLLVDWLQYGAEEPEGVLAILYRALWAMAEVRGKLSRYEDTGLEPEEVVQTKLALMGKVLAEIKEFEGVPAGRMIELAQAEKDGRLVVLPADRVHWIKAILAERERQDQKWGYPQENTYCEWSSILAEETGELAKELNELNFGRGDPDRMAEEAVQVATVALSILEQAAVAHRVTMQAAIGLGRMTRQEAEAALKKWEEAT